MAPAPKHNASSYSYPDKPVVLAPIVPNAAPPTSMPPIALPKLPPMMIVAPGKENMLALPSLHPSAKPTVPISTSPIPTPMAAAPAPATNNKKRKSTDAAPPTTTYPTDANIDDIDLDELDGPTENCDQVRRKIRRFLDAGAMTKGAFCTAIGVSAKSLNGFLGENGAFGGSGFAAYDAAWAWFKRREMAGVPFPKSNNKGAAKEDKAPAGKRRKTGDMDSPAGETVIGSGAAAASAPAYTGNSAGVDISSIHLPGESTDSLPVFETCDEVRRKIDAHLRTRPGATAAQLCRDMHAQLFSSNKPAGIQGKQLADFRSKKGARAGARISVFYGAYVFFEKVRIKEGRAKSQHRLKMEKIWPEGFDREDDGSRG
jgi:hypothetical protein